MITKLLQATHFGIFKAFEWKQDLNPFVKKNIFYAYNGGGKTTLSNIFRMFSNIESTAQKTELSNELRTDNDSNVKIEANGKKHDFNPEKGIGNIYVFNCDFVTEHIYEGTTSKMKRFSDKVKSNLKDKEINDLENEATEKQNELDKTKEQIQKLEAHFNAIKSEVSSDFGKRISNKRLSNVDISSLPKSLKSADELRKDIDIKVHQYNLSLESEQLSNDIDKLRTLHFGNIEVKGEAIEDLLSRDILVASSDRLKQKIERLKGHADEEVSQGVESWFRKAKALLHQEKHSEQATCPVCASDITSTLDLLVTEYNAYFNQEYDSFLSRLSQAIQYVPALVNKVADNSDNVNVIKDMFSRYSPNEAIANLDSSIITNSLLKLQQLYERRKADVKTSLLSEFDSSSFAKEIAAYNLVLDNLKKAKERLIAKLDSQKLDPKALEGEIKDLYKQLAFVLFDNDGKTSGQVEHFANLTAKVITVTAMLTGINTRLAKARAKLKNEAKHVNRFLQELGIHHFTIDIHETKPSENIEIIYETGSRKTKLKHSISDGEKTALSFAYFLSKIKHEVIDNEEAKLEDTIIVLDDPVSSLDENRLYSTAWIINSCLSNAKQLFVLSHNLVFLKFLGNVIGHSERNDYFLSNHRGEVVLENLPYGLSNYTTVYFQKLEDIINFTEGKLKYLDAKNFIPGNIRIVLEAFLSFKLCTLKNGSSGEGNRIAGLDKLINRLNGSIGLYKTFKTAGGIDSKNLVATLRKIQRITDPQAHGSPQSIQEFNFISESELKEIAENTINIIKFLDCIHYESSAQVAA